MKNLRPILMLLACLAVTGKAQTVDSVITNGLFEPYEVTVGSDNVYYLADSANHRIARYDPSTGFLTTLAGLTGEAGYVDGPGFFARFSTPRGVVFARGGLVVADSGNNLLRFVTVTGQVAMVTTLAGSTTSGNINGAGAAARFNFPVGLAADSQGNVYIADFKNRAIRKLDSANTVTTIATGFSRPASLALDDAGKIYVADSGDNTIRMIDAQGRVSLLAGNIYGLSGSRDDYFATNALFAAPGGLLWAGNTLGLLVSDTGNHTLRKIFVDQDLSDYFGTDVWSVSTYAGKAGEQGLVNGPLLSARFFGPMGLAKDYDNGILAVDSISGALRRIQVAPPRPPVSDPVIGYVIFIIDEKTGEKKSKLVPIEDTVFYNETTIAILAEPHTVTYTLGPTPQIDEPDSIPTPIPGIVGERSLPYWDGMYPDEVPPSLVSPQPDFTVKALATDPPRRPSNLIRSRMQFRTAPPVILGDNPAHFTVLTETAGAQIYYTIDDSVVLTNDTTVNGVQGPILSGDIVSLKITNNITFRAQAFRDHFQASLPISKQFSPTNFNANRLTFGFENGEASSRFIAAAGQTFYAPVTLSLIPNQKMYTLQFGVVVTNLIGPKVNSGLCEFESMLMAPVKGQEGAYHQIPPAVPLDQVFLFTNDISTNLDSLFEIDLPSGFPSSVFENYNGEPVASLHLKNTNNNLLMIGWLERVTKTNLYNTKEQDLIAFSIAHDRLWKSSEGKVIVGGYSFTVPTNAALDQEYQIKLIRPSATSDGISADVYIETPTNNSLGLGSINAIKHVKVGSARYVVGDVAPFRWFNAGDFGEGWLLNNDVVQVFQSMLFPGTNFMTLYGYGLNRPPEQSDMFDAMDSSDSLNHLERMMSNGADAEEIDKIKFGDGILDVTDVYVTFRRSLDPSLKWYARFWSNGVLNAEEVPNTFRGEADRPAIDFSNRQAASPAESLAGVGSTSPPSVVFSAGDILARAGEKVTVPIRASITGPHPIRTLLMFLRVNALGGSPALDQNVVFRPATGIGQPTFSQPLSTIGYAAAWLNSSASGLWGDTEVGSLDIIIPSTAAADSVYRVEFANISASPNGLGLFPQQVQNGLLALRDLSQSSWQDLIPDHWRLRYFGEVSNLLSDALADADGDGVPNWAEFKAGTDPVDVRSRLRLWASRIRNGLEAGAPPQVVVKWPSVKGKKYLVEAALEVFAAEWATLVDGIEGTGGEMEYADPDSNGLARFYRVRLKE
ncbi:MAG TPA: hypothetical protein P5186_08625 [Candidatus Paceibacterota bacterium]|nr:hypothetical protein [Candidatus Paceibacterota bacterium]